LASDRNIGPRGRRETRGRPTLRRMVVEQLTGPVAFHAEGPVWSESWGGLRWVDMQAGDILALAPDGTVTRTHVGEVAAVVRPRTTGGAVIGVERGFVLEGPDGALTRLPELWADAGVRMNEGGCDPEGRFYCGSMAKDEAPGAGTLFRLDADLSVHTVLEGVSVSNGLEWSPDGRLAYYDDTPTQQVAVFDHDAERGLTGRRTLVTIAEEDGSPDGLTVDAEGGIWVALYGGGAVRRYTPEGRLDAVVEVPVTNVTACTFGGPRLEQLFITTTQEGVDTDAEPAAGSVFQCTPGVAGRPVRPFAG
jgi:sugar lactone lactonase YvrE